MDKIYNYLSKVNEVSLFARVGYVLEHLKNDFGVTEIFLDKIKENLTNRTYYLDINEKGNSRHVKDWKLMVPDKVLDVMI